MDSDLKNFLLPLARKHVQGARWATDIGTDYWMQPALLMGTAGGTEDAAYRLIDNGWTLEAEHGVAGAGSELFGGVKTAGIPATPGTPPHIYLNTSGDLIVSPPVFGSYEHAWAAAQMVGKENLPNQLVMDVRAAFIDGSTDEEESGFGFFEDATTTTTATEALQLAFISCNATNFQLATNASTTLMDNSIAVIDNAWHTWRIVLDFDTAGVIRARWFIDKVLQGAIVPTTAEAPYAWGAHVLTNDLRIGIVHIFYDWV